MEFGFPHERAGDVTPVWNIGISFEVIVRVVNILIIFRVLRILADVKVSIFRVVDLLLLFSHCKTRYGAAETSPGCVMVL